MILRGCRTAGAKAFNGGSTANHLSHARRGSAAELSQHNHAPAADANHGRNGEDAQEAEAGIKRRGQPETRGEPACGQGWSRSPPTCRAGTANQRRQFGQPHAVEQRAALARRASQPRHLQLCQMVFGFIPSVVAISVGRTPRGACRNSSRTTARQPAWPRAAKWRAAASFSIFRDLWNSQAARQAKLL